MRIYFPVSCRILTVGHIKCLAWLYSKSTDIVIGVITDEGMKGYKDPIVPFKDRFEIVETIATGMRVVTQSSLDPTENVKNYRCDAIASGDGWEKCELEAIKKFKLKKINIPLPKKYSSSKIIQDIKIHV